MENQVRLGKSLLRLPFTNAQKSNWPLLELGIEKVKPFHLEREKDALSWHYLWLDACPHTDINRFETFNTVNLTFECKLAALSHCL